MDKTTAISVVVYKVCRFTPNKGVFKSWSAALGDYTAFYTIGVETKPPIGGLFAFRTLISAENFVKTHNPNYEYSVILKCEAVIYEQPITHIIDRFSGYSGFTHQIDDFWNYGEAQCLMPVPQNTVVCNSITPIERIR